MKLTDVVAIDKPINMVQRLEIDLSEETKNFLLELFQVEPEHEKCVARIEVDTEEVVKRIKEEYDITDGWIPCSEKLPKDNDWVIVTILEERGDTPYRYTDFGWYLEVANCWIIDAERRTDVTAWMPLPKPYREVEK